MIDLDMVHDGLNNGEFFLEYLPIVSLDREICVGAEALLRWQRPDGVMEPDDFIPLVENTPMSGLLTYWVIDEVARELGGWLRGHDGVELHINVPPEIIGRGGMEYAARKSGLSDVKHKVVLEITERGLPDSLGLKAIDRAVRSGVRIALDDHTIDPAGVMVLSRCSASIIKVDKTVIDDMQGTPMPAWAQALAVLLQTTDIEVIVEGVETAEQLAVLRLAGVRKAQGYYFSRPLRAAAFMAYFRDLNQ